MKKYHLLATLFPLITLAGLWSCDSASTPSGNGVLDSGAIDSRQDSSLDHRIDAAADLRLPDGTTDIALDTLGPKPDRMNDASADATLNDASAGATLNDASADATQNDASADTALNDVLADTALADTGTQDGPTSCTAPVAPAHEMVLNSTSMMNHVDLIHARGKVFATLPFGYPFATEWLRWTGTGWAQEAIPWPAGLISTTGISKVVQLPTGDALIVSNKWLMVFDGVAMTSLVEWPAWVTNPWSFTRTSDGRLHIFHGKQMTSSKTGGGWDQADALPLPNISEVQAAALADDRIVIIYNDVFYDPNDLVHLHVVSRTPTTNWTTPQDLTPNWGVRANDLTVLGVPGGGVIIGATGSGASLAAIWRSTDGVTFGNYEDAGQMRVAHLAAACLEHPVVTLGYQTAYSLVGRVGGNWTTLEYTSLNYLDDASGIILPGGETFWGVAGTNHIKYYSP